MALTEFDLIDEFFNRSAVVRDDVALAIGDDAALLDPPAGKQLVVSVDTLVSGVHFPEQTAAVDIGYKALAVNLSDMAAMGATPAWGTLAITLPKVDGAWLGGFCDGFFDLAREHGLQLIGGDTTRGPLTITVQVTGLVDRGGALKRGGAGPGDLIYVSGDLGAAGLGLSLVTSGKRLLPVSAGQYCIERLNRPTPRVALGQALSGIASAAIDISDGLVADLGHILERSACGATLEVECLPVVDAVRTSGSQPWWTLPLTAGDDYELCFTVPEHKREALEARVAALDVPVTCVGRIDAVAGLRLVDGRGMALSLKQSGYLHFDTAAD